MTATPAERRRKVAVLCVHGIGEQKSGTTLRQVGGPLIELLRDAVVPRGGTFTIARATTLGSDGPMSVAAEVNTAHGSMELQVYESCWAASFRPASFGEMGIWLPLTGIRILVAMGIAAARGLKTSDRWLVGADAAVGNAVEAVTDQLKLRPTARIALGALLGRPQVIVQRFIAFGRVALYLVAFLAILALAGLLMLVPLLVAALFVAMVWKVTRGTASSLRSGLAASIGDAFTFQRRLLDRSAMVQQVRDDLDTVRADGAQAIIIIAHSLGSAITYEALLKPAAQEKVALLVTVGNALGLVGIAQRRTRKQPIIEPLPLPWWDYFTSFDPVPAGQLAFAAPGPSSQLVANHQSITRDHSGYFVNIEQVMGPIAARVLRDGGLEPPVGSESHNNLSARVDAAAVVRRNRKNAQSTLSFLFVLGLVATTLTLSAALIKDIGDRIYDVGGGLLAPIPDPLEAWLRAGLEREWGQQWLGAFFLAAVGGLLYRFLLAKAWDAWDVHAAARFVGTEDRLYEPTQMRFPAVAVLAPIFGLGGLAFRARFGLPATGASTAAAYGTAGVLAFQVLVLLATHLTLETKDLAPRGVLLRLIALAR